MALLLKYHGRMQFLNTNPLCQKIKNRAIGMRWSINGQLHQREHKSDGVYIKTISGLLQQTL